MLAVVRVNVIILLTRGRGRVLLHRGGSTISLVTLHSSGCCWISHHLLLLHEHSLLLCWVHKGCVVVHLHLHGRRVGLRPARLLEEHTWVTDVGLHRELRALTRSHHLWRHTIHHTHLRRWLCENMSIFSLHGSLAAIHLLHGCCGCLKLRNILLVDKPAYLSVGCMAELLEFGHVTTISQLQNVLRDRKVWRL